jgi:DNA modification methylase
MTGHGSLDEILPLMAGHLKYQWVLTYLTPGPNSAVYAHSVRQAWKPILWFVKGKYQGPMVTDVVKSPAPDKSYHKHGQSVAGFEQLIKRFSRPGDTILDPIMGGGTTGEAALHLGRKFIGVDIDSEAVETTKKRLAKVAREMDSGEEFKQHPGNGPGGCWDWRLVTHPALCCQIRGGEESALETRSVGQVE